MVTKEQDLRTRLIAEAHTQVSTAHPRKTKTRKIISDRYYWPGLVTDINRYIWNCDSCCKSTIPQDKTPGLLKPLLILERPWQHISIDFYKLPIDYNRYNMAIVIVNCFSKYLFLILYHKNIDAKEAA